MTKASPNLQRLSHIYSVNPEMRELTNKSPVSGAPSGVGSLSPIKKKSMLIRELSKERIDNLVGSAGQYHPTLAPVGSGVGLNYIPMKNKYENIESRLPKLPALKDPRNSDSPTPAKIIGGYKYSSPGARLANISALQKI